MSDNQYIQDLHKAIKEGDTTYGFPNDHRIETDIAERYNVSPPSSAKSYYWPRYSGDTWFLPPGVIIDIVTHDAVSITSSDDENADGPPPQIPDESPIALPDTRAPELNGEHTGIQRMAFQRVSAAEFEENESPPFPDILF